MRTSQLFSFISSFCLKGVWSFLRSLIPAFNLLRVARRYFSKSSVSDDLFFSPCRFLVLLLALSFMRLILSLSFLCCSVSEALFALSYSFLGECCFYVHAKAALAYSRNEYYGYHGSVLTGLMKVELEKWFPLKSELGHYLYFFIQPSPPFIFAFL